jgi:hypothetical protein
MPADRQHCSGARVYVGTIDDFQIGGVMNKALTIRTEQQHGHKFIAERLRVMNENQLSRRPDN